MWTYHNKIESNMIFTFVCIEKNFQYSLYQQKINYRSCPSLQ